MHFSDEFRSQLLDKQNLMLRKKLTPLGIFLIFLQECAIIMGDYILINDLKNAQNCGNLLVIIRLILIREWRKVVILIYFIIYFMNCHLSYTRCPFVIVFCWCPHCLNEYLLISKSSIFTIKKVNLQKRFHNIWHKSLP